MPAMSDGLGAVACKAEGGACRPHAHAHTGCWSRVTRLSRVAAGSRVWCLVSCVGAASMARQPAAQHPGGPTRAWNGNTRFNHKIPSEEHIWATWSVSSSLLQFIMTPQRGEITIFRQRRLNIQQGNKKKCVTFIQRIVVVVVGSSTLDLSPEHTMESEDGGCLFCFSLIPEVGRQSVIPLPDYCDPTRGEYPTQLILCPNSRIVWLLAGVCIILHFPFVGLYSRSALVL